MSISGSVKIVGRQRYHPKKAPQAKVLGVFKGNSFRKNDLPPHDLTPPPFGMVTFWPNGGCGSITLSPDVYRYCLFNTPMFVRHLFSDLGRNEEIYLATLFHTFFTLPATLVDPTNNAACVPFLR